MAPFMLTDVDLLASGLDLACFTSQAEISTEVEQVDSTVFCSAGWRSFVPGLRTTTITASGPTDFATATAAQQSAIDEVLAVNVGGEYAVSLLPIGATVGEAGYFTTAGMTSRTVLSGTVGDLATHQVQWTGRAPLIRGTIVTASTLTATGSSAAVNLGAVTANQKVWAVFHTLTAGGTTPSVTYKIQSDDNSGMTSPTDRITFGAATSKTGSVSSTAGAITDTWWRATWTITGTSPSFITRILIGIY